MNESIAWQALLFRYRLAVRQLRTTDEKGRVELLASVLMPSEYLEQLSIQALEEEG